MLKLLRWLTVILTIAMLLAYPGADYFAKAADGEGDGSGGGQNNPLAVESCVPADGAAGVTNLEYVKIVFTKNVAYITIREANKKCFSLWSGGQRIPAEIIIADDQIEREKRNDVLVKPLQSLRPGATYLVEITPDLQSKSGIFLGQKVVISFTMAGTGPTAFATEPGVTQPVSAPDAGAASPEVAGANSPGGTDSTGKALNEIQPSVASLVAETNTPAQVIANYLYWILLIAAICIGGWFYRKSRSS